MDIFLRSVTTRTERGRGVDFCKLNFFLKSHTSSEHQAQLMTGNGFNTTIPRPWVISFWHYMRKSWKIQQEEWERALIQTSLDTETRTQTCPHYSLSFLLLSSLHDYFFNDCSSSLHFSSVPSLCLKSRHLDPPVLSSPHFPCFILPCLSSSRFIAHLFPQKKIICVHAHIPHLHTNSVYSMCVHTNFPWDSLLFIFFPAKNSSTFFCTFFTPQAWKIASKD